MPCSVSKIYFNYFRFIFSYICWFPVWHCRHRVHPKIGTAWRVRAGVDWIGGGRWRAMNEKAAGTGRSRTASPTPRWRRNEPRSRSLCGRLRQENRTLLTSHAPSSTRERRRHPARGRLDRPAMCRSRARDPCQHTRVCSPLSPIAASQRLLSLNPSRSAAKKPHLCYLPLCRLPRAKINLHVCVYDKNDALRQQKYCHPSRTFSLISRAENLDSAHLCLGKFSFSIGRQRLLLVWLTRIYPII